MKRQSFMTLSDEHGVQKIIDVLEPHLTDKRKAAIHRVLSKRLDSIHVAVEAPSDIHNALAAIRSCEAFGVPHVHIVAWEGKRNKGRQTSQGSYRWTDVQYHATFEDFIGLSAVQPLVLIGAGPGEGVSLDEVPVDKPLCLLFGNEERGLSQQAIDQCGLTYSIPMFGMVESLNLSVSVGISLYDIAHRRREYLKKDGELEGETLQRERARYYIRSLGLRRSQAILQGSFDLPNLEF